MRSLWLVLVVCACNRDTLISDGSEDIAVTPSVNFLATPLGFSRTQSLTVMNRSRSPVTLQVSAEDPFSMPETLSLAGGEVVDLPVTFAPQSLGTHSRTARVGASQVLLSGAGIEVPSCEPTSTCLTGRFDAETLACVFTPKADGAVCGSPLECVEHGLCRAGTCEGAAVQCDDGNACTSDACAVGQGCMATDASASCPEPSTPCLAAVCTPETGCGTVTVVDGTPCGDVSCDSADVCLAGTCRTVVPPDGFECQPATACQGAGICRDHVCERPPAQPLSPRFTYTGSESVEALHFSGVTDPLGNWYWVECGHNAPRDIFRERNNEEPGGTRPPFESMWCEAISATNTSTERYRWRHEFESEQVDQTLARTLTGKQVLAGGLFIYAGPGGTLVAVDMNTGALRWTNTTAPRSILELAEDGRGTLWALSSPESSTGGPAGVLRLDTATGAQRSLTPAAVNRSAPGLVLDSAGNAYIVTLSPTSSLVSFSATGAARFSVSPGNMPRLSVDDVVMGEGELTVRTDGSILMGNLNPGHQPRVAESATSWFSTESNRAGNGVRHASGASLRFGFQHVSDLWLTASGDALFTAFDSVNKPLPAPLAEVIQFSKTGQTVQRCSLTQTDELAVVGFNGTTLATANDQTIHFYDVGALGFSARGWVGPRGRPDGSGRPR